MAVLSRKIRLLHLHLFSVLTLSKFWELNGFQLLQPTTFHRQHRRGWSSSTAGVVRPFSRLPVQLPASSSSASNNEDRGGAGRGGDSARRADSQAGPTATEQTARPSSKRSSSSKSKGLKSQQSQRTGQKKRINSLSPNSSSPSSPPRKKSDGSAGGGNLDMLSAYYKTPTARSVALEALTWTMGGRGGTTQRKSTVERLEALSGLSTLEVRDRAFARLLVATVERRRGQLNRVIDYCSTKKKQTSANPNSSPNTTSVTPPNTTDPFLRSVLQLGLAQLLFLRVPPYAAVQETVELLRRRRPASSGNSNNQGPRQRSSSMAPPVAEAQVKFVNAVLRRAARSLEGSNDDDDETHQPEILRLADASDIGLNVAPWLLKELQSAWGLEATERILQSAMEETPRCLTVRFNQSDHAHSDFEHIEAMAHLFGGPNATQILPQDSIRLLQPPSGPVSSWPLYEEGAWWLQDASATLPAQALLVTLRGTLNRPELRLVVDMCAAPGGKTAQLCNFLDPKHFNLTAVEISAARSRRLKENLARLRMECDVVVADGTEWIPPTKATAVLLDAPCTATGTASKRPDVLWRSNDYQELVDTQYRLACHALDHLLDPFRQGTLVYATCSLLKAEGEDQIDKLLAEYGDAIAVVPFTRGEIPGFDAAIVPNRGWMRVLPGDPGLVESGIHPCDGFFVARLRLLRPPPTRE